ncbi:hypothetical protein, partial [Mesorhizobium sp.]|uniref:hypothetical protein n=1 Tax=Mesorhizobium sp. TaxID=1871066 RepID=UPI0025CC25F3
MKTNGPSKGGPFCFVSLSPASENAQVELRRDCYPAGSVSVGMRWRLAETPIAIVMYGRPLL